METTRQANGRPLPILPPLALDDAAEIAALIDAADGALTETDAAGLLELMAMYAADWDAWCAIQRTRQGEGRTQ